MFGKFSFWLWGLVVSQLLTAAFHSLSFFAEPQPANEKEKQFLELMTTYKQDLGAGFHRTFYEIFIPLSACFTLICLLGGVVNWYLKRRNIGPDLWRGLLLIQLIIFGILFALIARFTFLPPIICTALIFIFSIGSYFSLNKAYGDSAK